MKHLRKAAALLVTVLLLIFVVPRIMPTSSFLESYGFYPKKYSESTMSWQSQPTKFSGTTGCTTCHKDRQISWAKSKHAGVSCETCHGPAGSHVEKLVKLAVDTSRESCGACHAQVTARPASFPQVDLSQHGGQSPCVTCHSPHDPKVPAQSPPVPHAVEGRADCLVCHKAGGIKPFPGNHEGNTNAACLTCHGSNKNV